jgi:hypothetical protein
MGQTMGQPMSHTKVCREGYLDVRARIIDLVQQNLQGAILHWTRNIN